VKVEATLGLGGNIGDPVKAFAAALTGLSQAPGVTLKRVSSVYRTAPWGKLDQPEFLNLAVLVEADLPALQLLELCLSLERSQGRERHERWGPRTLDIDILTYGTAAIEQPGLQVPHPRIAERAFVLAPLAEIVPELLIGGIDVSALRDRLADEDVRRDEAETKRLADMRGA
jgi:2-amino-4-hydroxy-6-hydroxymethyldihydropteridine diphosphokinase